MNTFNYLLSDFLTSNRNATYGPDYYVVGKQLMVPLSSTWMANVTSIETVNKSLCSLNLSKTPKLSAITINDENIVNFTPPATNTNFLCAFNVKTYDVSLTGSNYKYVVFINSNELRSLNLRRVSNLEVFNVLNCPKLSTIEFNAFNTFNSTVSNFYINLYNNNLTDSTINNLYLSLSGGYIFSGVPFTNVFVSICNPVTGSSAIYNVIKEYPGLNISLQICGTPASGSNPDLLFAEKL